MINLLLFIYSFTQRADVRKHKKTVHEKARDFHCSECKLSFGEVRNLLLTLKCFVVTINPISFFYDKF